MLVLYFVFLPSYNDQMFLDLKSYNFAVQYGNILLCGMVLIWTFNVLMAITRGIGNTKIVAICWFMVLISQVFLASFNFEIEAKSIKLTNAVAFSFLNLFFQPIEWSAISFLGGFVFGIISVSIFYIFFNHPLRFRYSEILKFDGILALFKSGSFAGCQSILTITISLLSLSITFKASLITFNSFLG